MDLNMAHQKPRTPIMLHGINELKHLSQWDPLAIYCNIYTIWVPLSTMIWSSIQTVRLVYTFLIRLGKCSGLPCRNGRVLLGQELGPSAEQPEVGWDKSIR